MLHLASANKNCLLKKEEMWQHVRFIGLLWLKVLFAGWLQEKNIAG
jgi:hypothetical protein